MDLTSGDEREQRKVRGEVSKAMGLKIKKNLGVEWLEQEVILADLKRQGQFKHLKDETLVFLDGLDVKESIPGDDKNSLHIRQPRGQPVENWPPSREHQLGREG